MRQDLVLAHAHSRIAAELDAEGMAPKIKPFLKVIEGRMTPDEISRARDMAREWLVIHRR